MFKLPSLDTLNTAHKVGQFFMPAAFINDTEEEIQKLENLIKNYHIGSLCFFHSRASAATNFEGKKKVIRNEKSIDRLKELITRYQKISEIPLLIAIDAEWGLAMRIENAPQYPYPITLGALQNQDKLIFEIGYNIGLDCKEAGIHWNLAPVLDINNNPENPVIGYRSFSDEKEKVKIKAGAFLDGMKHAGVLNSLKHFPGHGDTNVDSHLGLPVIDKSEQELFQNELYLYQELLKRDIDSVMVAHLSLPQIDDSGNPSSISKKIINRLLRKKMSYDGVIISDALNMHAVSKRYPENGTLEAAAFDAGMDMLCFPENPIEGIETILATSDASRIEESFNRIWKLKQKTFETYFQKENVRKKTCKELNIAVAKNCITELGLEEKVFNQIKKDKFLNLSYGNPKKNNFSKSLEKQFGQAHLKLTSQSLEDILSKAEQYQNIVLALFPPSNKPKNQFGFEPEVLDLIQRLLIENKVILYLFGNPYVLNIFEHKAKSGIVLMYQDFSEFQEMALDHFLGKISAKGKLPVKLKGFTE